MNKRDKIPTNAEIIRNRRKALFIRHGYISLLIRILLLSVTAYLLLTQVFLITRVKGNDMFPALKDGDLVIAFRLQREYAKDDVVIYTDANTNRIARIAALENDLVSFGESGVFYVNGAVQRGEIVYPTYPKEELNYPLTVPKGSLFLLGDHRTQAFDSRDIGTISKDHINGKVITILRRRGL